MYGLQSLTPSWPGMVASLRSSWLKLTQTVEVKPPNFCPWPSWPSSSSSSNSDSSDIFRIRSGGENVSCNTALRILDGNHHQKTNCSFQVALKGLLAEYLLNIKDHFVLQQTFFREDFPFMSVQCPCCLLWLALSNFLLAPWLSCDSHKIKKIKNQSWHWNNYSLKVLTPRKAHKKRENSIFQ